MTKQLTYVVVRENNHWATDDSLPETRARFKRLTGKFPTKKASIVAYTGSYKDLEKIQIDDVTGSILYPKSLTQAILQ